MQDLYKDNSLKNKIKLTVAYNYLGAVVGMAVPIISMKYYLDAFGPHLWGVISFVVLLQLMLGLLDAGLSQSFIREVVKSKEKKRVSLLVKGFELSYLVFSMVVLFIVCLVIDYVVHGWMKVSPDEIEIGRFAVCAAFVLFVFQIYNSLYKSVLIGTNKQGVLNAINSFHIVFVNLGGVFVAYQFRDVFYYLTWLVVFTLMTVLIRRLYVFNRCLEPTKWSDLLGFKVEIFDVVKNCGKFSLGVSIGVLVTHVDKVIVSKILPIEQLGYYTIAASISIGVVQFVYPIGQAFLPKLIWAKNNNMDFNRINKIFVLINSVIVVVGVVTYYFFGHWLLKAWLGNAASELIIYPLMSLLVIGSSLAAIAEVAYTNWICDGDLKKVAIRNIFALIFSSVFLPGLINSYGLEGAAASWIFVNLITLILGYSVYKNIFYCQQKTKGALF